MISRKLEGFNTLKKTKNSLIVDKLYVSQMEEGSPITSHCPAYIDLMWADMWRSLPFQPWYIEELDSIGSLLVNS